MKSLILATALATSPALATDKFTQVFTKQLMTICSSQPAFWRDFRKCWDRFKLIMEDIAERCWDCTWEQAKEIMLENVERYIWIMENEKFLKS